MGSHSNADQLLEDPDRTEAIYISGPMTGLPEFNRTAFFLAEEQLRQVGFSCVINPAHVEAENDTEGWAYPQFLRAAIKLMLESATVATLPGWESSRGAQAEVSLARTLEMPVVTVEGLLAAAVSAHRTLRRVSPAPVSTP